MFPGHTRGSVLFLAVGMLTPFLTASFAEQSDSGLPQPGATQLFHGNRLENGGSVPDSVNEEPQLDPRILAFCKNPYQICAKYRSDAKRRFFPSRNRAPANRGRRNGNTRNSSARRAEVEKFLNGEVKPAVLLSIQKEPGLSPEERERAVRLVSGVKMVVSSDPMACGPGGSLINAMAQRGRNRMMICMGMVDDAFRRAEATGRSYKNFIFHPASHELGHFLNIRPAMAGASAGSGARRVHRCVETQYNTRRANRRIGRGQRASYVDGGQVSHERVADYWANHAFYSWLGDKADGAQALSALEDSFSTLCTRPRQDGYPDHPPIPERALAMRYSPLAETLGCPLETDRFLYCSSAGPFRRNGNDGPRPELALGDFRGNRNPAGRREGYR